MAAVELLSCVSRRPVGEDWPALCQWLLAGGGMQALSAAVLHCGALIEGPLRGRRLTRLIATHFHPDHIGLAHWLCARWEVPLWISATDFYVARLGSATSSPRRSWRSISSITARPPAKWGRGGGGQTIDASSSTPEEGEERRGEGGGGDPGWRRGHSRSLDLALA